MSTHGHTSESVSQMKFDEAEKNGVSTEEYMRLKAYFNTHKSQSLAGNDQEKDRKLTLDIPPTTDPNNVPFGQMPIAAPAMPYYQQQPGAVQPVQNGQPAMQATYPHQQAYQPQGYTQPHQQPYQAPYQQTNQPAYQQGYPQPYQQYPAAQPTVIVVNTPAPDESIACNVIGGLLVSLFFSPIFGLCGCCLGSKRQRGAWLIGSGSGGIFHSISYYIIGAIFQSSANYLSNNPGGYVYTYGPNGYTSYYSATYYREAANTSRSVAIAMFVIGSILLIACLAEIIVGSRLMRNTKANQTTQMTMKNTA